MWGAGRVGVGGLEQWGGEWGQWGFAGRPPQWRQGLSERYNIAGRVESLQRVAARRSSAAVLAQCTLSSGRDLLTNGLQM